MTRPGSVAERRLRILELVLARHPDDSNKAMNLARELAAFVESWGAPPTVGTRQAPWGERPARDGLPELKRLARREGVA